MTLTELLISVAELKIRLSVAGDRLNVQAPKGALTTELTAALVHHKAELLALLRHDSADALLQLRPDPASRHEPFALTDIQRAYFIGRSGGFELSMPCQLVYEVEARDLDVARLEAAWRRVVERHDMLRAVVHLDGTQQVLRELPTWSVGEIDLKGLASDAVEPELERLRHELLRRSLPSNCWPLFELRILRLPAAPPRFQWRIELTTLDARSVQILLQELVAYYQNPALHLPPLSLTFRDYVLAEVQSQSTAAWQRSRDYWHARLPTLGPAPELPTASDAAKLTRPTARRKAATLPAANLARLRARAQKEGITDAALLATAWAELLATWSRTRPFSLNLTLFNRPEIHPEISKVVGDFTSTLILSMEVGSGSFRERARATQVRLAEDLEHARYSGVRVLRELNRQRGGTLAAAMPIVLTILLGPRANMRIDTLEGWRLCWSASQTPQVWLDHQIYADDTGLIAQWDHIAELFPQPMIDSMMAAWIQRLTQLANEPDAWTNPAPELLPPGDRRLIAEVNATDRNLALLPLHASVWAAVQRGPDRIAVIKGSTSLTYRALWTRASALARVLRAHGLAREELCAVVLDKGPEQVVAVLGILLSGGAYLPISADLPVARRRALLSAAAVRFAVSSQDPGWEGTQAISLDELTLAPEKELSAPPPHNGEQLAYVIYTSGSTGAPKGVMIEHRSAANTVADINERCGIGPGDRVLAVSSLSFDLSVWDLFGILSAGGAVVYAEAERDPAAWLDAIVRHGVTVWNSVPALLDLLVDTARSRGERVPLRLALLSGDWIPVDLPDRLRAIAGPLRIWGLGGATEAAIWSVCYPIDSVDPAWPSIPYGRAMANQSLTVRDEHLRLRPVGVAGDLYIGGHGLARGYLGDPDKTSERFVLEPRSGQRLYRTGDLARLLPDGNLEFLGREDHQVKLRGHRVELGEIEAALRTGPGVEQAVVSAVGESRGARRLLAWVAGRTPLTDPAAGEERWHRLLAVARQQAATEAATAPLPPAELAAVVAALDRLATAFIARTFRQHGLFAQSGERLRSEAVMQRLQIQPGYRAWTERALSQLVSAGLLAREADVFRADAPLPQELPPAPTVALFTDTVALVTRAGRGLAAILRGEAHPASILFPDDDASAAVRLYDRAFAGCNQIAGAIAAQLGDRPLRVLEVGAGVGSTTAHVLPELSAQSDYIYTDISRWFLDVGRRRFGADLRLSYRVFDVERGAAEQGIEPNSFDLIIAASVLHATRVIADTLNNLRGLLRPDGLLLILEETHFWPSFNLTMGLQPGFDRFADTALRNEHPLLSAAGWQRALAEAGFAASADLSHAGSPSSYMGYAVLLSRGPQSTGPDPVALRRHLTELLPDYMVPSAIYPMAELPLTANGKIDRRRLVVPELLPMEGTGTAPTNEVQTALVRLWAEVLNIAAPGIHDNFFALGGDSLLAGRLLARVRELTGTEVSLRALFESPTIAALAQQVATGRPIKKTAAPLTPDPTQRFEPFPLTPLQQAYWVGRGSGMDVGNVAGHVYFEFESDELDLERLERAWNRLVWRHDTLRMVISPDGLQRVLPEVPEYRIAVHVDPLAVRHRMSHQVLPTERWPLFELAATQPAGRVRLHISLDTLLGDAWAFRVVFSELQQLYRDPSVALPERTLRFRDCVLAMESARGSARYQQDLAWWKERLAALPPPPELPQQHAAAPGSRPLFVRRFVRLAPDAYHRLTAAAAERSLTPTAVLAAAYAEVLSRCSDGAAFTLNVPTFNRPELHPEIYDVVGDFASFGLLAVDALDGRSFAARARTVHERLGEMLEHGTVHGVEILRELARSRADMSRNAFPVVFTSVLSLDSLGRVQPGPGALGEQGFSITQTPQVRMDFQVFETQGALTGQLDAVDALFPAGLVDGLVQMLEELLTRLADDSEAWERPLGDLIPVQQKMRRTPALAMPVPTALPHAAFAVQATQEPTRTAVIADDRSLSYRELDELAWRLAHTLRARGVSPDAPVPVVLTKGYRQVVAVLGVLRAGGAYLPIDPAVPAARLAELLEYGRGPTLTEPALEEKLSWPAGAARLVLEDRALATAPTTAFLPPQGPEHLTYVLFTSGSTGRPKGAMIEGRGVTNALLATAAAFAIGPADRVLGVTALHHDMSVFDVLGVLGAGGALVLPTAEGARDPAQLAELLVSHQVTIWNSVPAFLELLLEYVEAGHPLALPELRLALVGGDFIPLSLPERLRRIAPRCEFVSVGGPTETTLWNIWHRVDRVDPEWRSIPYGRPIANTEYRIVGPHGHDCADGVPGEMVVTGVGVARGYLGVPHDPRFGEDPRCYRTGDLGRFRPDGTIEILGRQDRQLKLLGQRIEPAEVEAALLQYPGLRAAVVGVVRGGRTLVAWVVGDQVGEAAIRAFLGRRLPPHMIPARVVELPVLPLTANGKVDHRALVLPEDSAAPTLAPPTELLQRLLTLVEEVLGLRGVQTSSNLISLGANSLDLVRLSNRIEQQFGVRPVATELFRDPTIENLARALGSTGQSGAADDRAPAALRERLTSYRILGEPAERQSFRAAQRGLRAVPEGSVVPLPGPVLDAELQARYAARRTQRRFSLVPVPHESFGRLLSCLRQLPTADGPRYLYPSGGGLYPVQVYVHVRPGRVQGVSAGTYYYSPVAHGLLPLHAGADIARSVHVPFVNQPVYDEAAFSLFFLCDLDAIGPMYGPDSIHIATLEAGILGQLLDTEATAARLGLCHIGSLNFNAIAALFDLGPAHVLIHSMLGGVPEGSVAPDSSASARASRVLQRIKQLSPDEVRTLLSAQRATGGKS